MRKRRHVMSRYVVPWALPLTLLAACVLWVTAVAVAQETPPDGSDAGTGTTSKESTDGDAEAAEETAQDSDGSETEAADDADSEGDSGSGEATQNSAEPGDDATPGDSTDDQTDTPENDAGNGAQPSSDRAETETETDPATVAARGVGAATAAAVAAAENPPLDTSKVVELATFAGSATSTMVYVSVIGVGFAASEPPPQAVAEVSPPPEQIPEVPAEPQTGAGDIQVDAIMPTGTADGRLVRVRGGYELHYNVISDDRSGNDWLAWYFLRGDLNVTKLDQLSLRLDLEQRFIADPNESGLYFGDIRLYYSRMFSLPIADFPIPGKASVYLTAPTSRASIQASYITRPTALLTFAPSWKGFTAIVTGFARVSFARYAQPEGREVSNEVFSAGFQAQLLYNVFDWFAPSIGWASTAALPHPTREGESQPWRDSYYLEAALNFSVPLPEQWPLLDMSLAYAQGANVLEDGVYRLHFSKRDQSELYFALNLTY